MKLTFQIFILILISFFSCKEHKGQNTEFIIGYGPKSNGQYNCGYAFSKDSILVKNVCLSGQALDGYSLAYYNNGIINTLEYFKNDTLQGNRIVYFNNGVINRILPVLNGKLNGEGKIYHTNGYLKAINLFIEDSAYYVRVYSDTNRIELFEESFIPIVTIENNTAQINDSIKIQVHFPMNKKFGIEPNNYVLHYDRNSAQNLKGILPRAQNSISLDGRGVEFGYSSTLPGYHQFYCYLTDVNNIIVGPTIYRDLFFKDYQRF